MIIFTHLQSKLYISFRGEDFQRVNMNYNRKNSPDPEGDSFIDRGIIIGKTAPPPPPWGPHLFTEQVCFSNFGKG